MNPIICLAKCCCVPKDALAIKALYQKTFDGEFIHFEMICLFCDKMVRVKETIESANDFLKAERKFLKLLEEPSFYGFLSQLVREGKTSKFFLL